MKKTVNLSVSKEITTETLIKDKENDNPEVTPKKVQNVELEQPVDNAAISQKMDNLLAKYKNCSFFSHQQEQQKQSVQTTNSNNLFSQQIQQQEEEQ